MFQTNVVEKIKTRIFCATFFFYNRAIDEMMWKSIADPDKPQMTIQCGASALHTGYLRLQIHTRNAPQYYVKRTLPVLLLSVEATALEEGNTYPDVTYDLTSNLCKSTGFLVEIYGPLRASLQKNS